MQEDLKGGWKLIVAFVVIGVIAAFVVTPTLNLIQKQKPKIDAVDYTQPAVPAP